MAGAGNGGAFWPVEVDVWLVRLGAKNGPLRLDGFMEGGNG